MKYAVQSEFYDNGKVNAFILEVTDDTTNCFNNLEKRDLYLDVFDSYSEAEKFLQECKNA